MSGGSGIMSSLGHWLGNMFSNSGTSASSSSSGGGSSGWLSAVASVAGSYLSSFAVGADNIPHDMVAQIHKGEMIIPAAGAEAIRSGKLGGHNINLGGIHVSAMDSQSMLTAMSGIQRELVTMLQGASYNLNMGRM